MADRLNIRLAEKFKDHEWTNYDAYDPTTRDHLRFQKHIDIRTFVDSSEHWTEGTYGYQTATAMYPSLSLPVTNGVTTTAISKGATVDLLTGFTNLDYITFALPSFPLANVNIDQSGIDFSSHPEGSFIDPTQVGIVRFTETLNPLIGGNNQFLFKRTLLEGQLDLGKVTAVRIRLQGIGSDTVTFMGLKMIAAADVENPESNPGWTVSSIDFDNWNGRLRKPTPLNGDTTSGPAYVQSTLWRSSPLPGIDDPQPIDVNMGIVFNTGSQTHANNITLFLREEPEIFQNQLDLIGETMADLDGRPQPDLGLKEFLPRQIREFEGESMGEFDRLQTMLSLERTAVADPIQQSWVYFRLDWGLSVGRVSIANSTSPGYIFPTLGATLKSQSNYLFVCELEGSGARAKIYELKPDFSVNQNPIFDSTLIDDDNVFRRRKGRIGWQVNLGDPDAFVESIRPRGVSFAEYVAAPLTSLTPVDGAQLFSNFTANTQLWDKGLNQYPKGSSSALATRDTTRSTTGESFKLIDYGTATNQGWETNPIEFVNFPQTVVKFDLWFPTSSRTIEETESNVKPLLPSTTLFPAKKLYPSHGESLVTTQTLSNIIVNLVSEQDAIYPLAMPEIEPDQWQTITLALPTEVIQTGLYTIQILQAPRKAASPATWWVDGIEIYERAVQWSARAVTEDPWKSNYAPWTDFHEIVNTQRDGIILSPRGKDLQVRAKALRQDASIVQAPTVKPHYAELGRLVWPEEAPAARLGPSVKILSPPAFLGERTFRFFGEWQEGIAESGEGFYAPIVLREWLFGDGERITGNSTLVTHTYATSGEYTVTLIAADRNGQYAQHSIVIFA